MKIIIILMLALICQFANGQPIMTINEHGTLDSTVFKPREKIPYVLTIENLILLYDKYSKECYADSTSFHYYKPKWNDTSCYRQTGNLAIGYDYVLVCENPDHFQYTHKTPDFLGFMEWLKTQTK